MLLSRPIITWSPALWVWSKSLQAFSPRRVFKDGKMVLVRHGDGGWVTRVLKIGAMEGSDGVLRTHNMWGASCTRDSDYLSQSYQNENEKSRGIGQRSESESTVSRTRWGRTVYVKVNGRLWTILDGRKNVGNCGNSLWLLLEME